MTRKGLGRIGDCLYYFFPNPWTFPTASQSITRSLIEGEIVSEQIAKVDVVNRSGYGFRTKS